MKDVSGKALGMDPNDGRGRVDVSHDESDDAFNPARRGWKVAIARLGIIDDAFEAEDTELSPASGEVGVGYFVDSRERHLFGIIRFDAHFDWIPVTLSTMQK